MTCFGNGAAEMPHFLMALLCYFDILTYLTAHCELRTNAAQDKLVWTFPRSLHLVDVKCAKSSVQQRAEMFLNDYDVS